MSKTSVKKKSSKSDERNFIPQCLEIMSSGTSLRKACAPLGLPKSTVWRHQQARKHQIDVPLPGSPCSLPLQLSNEIAAVARAAAEFGFGLS